jgi:hypothetical protein
MKLLPPQERETQAKRARGSLTDTFDKGFLPFGEFCANFLPDSE